MTHTKSNIVQSNEYYPFGQLAAGSWTRENAADNRYLANGGTELNRTSNLYDLEYRNYDPILGRLHQVDPMAAKYASVTPYNYSFNNAVNLTDPSGADPYNHSPGTWFGGGHYTYDDVMPNRGSDGWSQATGRAGMTGGDGWMGYSSSSMHGMGQGWYAGQGGFEFGMASARSFLIDAINSNHGGSWDDRTYESRSFSSAGEFWNLMGSYPDQEGRRNVGERRSSFFSKLFKGVASFFRGIVEGKDFGKGLTMFAGDDHVGLKKFMQARASEHNQMIVGFFLAKGTHIVLPPLANTTRDWSIDGVKWRVTNKGHLKIKVNGSWEQANGIYLAYPNYDAFYPWYIDHGGDRNVVDWYHSYIEEWKGRASKIYHLDFMFIFSDRPIGPWPFSDQMFISLPFIPNK